MGSSMWGVELRVLMVRGCNAQRNLTLSAATVAKHQQSYNREYRGTS